MAVLIFDIETIPDVQMGRRLYSLSNDNDYEVARMMLSRRQEETGGSDFLPLHLHRIVAISAVLFIGNKLKIGSLASLDAPESELITRFFNCIEKYTPTLVSWNGGSFDLPVLHYRALHHAVSAPTYWNIGETDSGFRWNNYLNRYHYRHMDLMDILSAYQPRAYAPLHEIALLLGLPGKLGMQGNQVFEQFYTGHLEAVRNYCEIDVLNTYLIYLNFEKMRGKLSMEQQEQAQQELIAYLKQAKKTHFDEFLSAWLV